MYVNRKVAIRSFVIVLGGEGLQSLFHLVLNVLLIRHLAATAFVAFSMVFLAGSIALTYLRALAGVPAMVFIPRGGRHHSVQAYDVTFGTIATALSCGMGAFVIVTVWVLARETGIALFGGLFVASWSLRSYLRFAAFAHHRPIVAAFGDAAFLAVGVAGVVISFVISKGNTVAHVLAALAMANAAGALVIMTCNGRRPRLSWRASVRRRYAAIWPDLFWSALGTTMTNAQVPAQLFIIAGFVGAEAYAPIAALFVVFAPLRIATTALVNVLQPEMSRRLATHPNSTCQLMFGAAGLMLVLGLAYCVALVVAFPLVRTYLLASMLDQPVAPIAVILGVGFVLAAVGALPRALLEAAVAFKTVAWTVASGAFIGLVCVVTGLYFGSTVYAVIGTTMSELVILLGFFGWSNFVVNDRMSLLQHNRRQSIEAT